MKLEDLQDATIEEMYQMICKERARRLQRKITKGMKFYGL